MNRQPLIGISGRKRAGKDTIAAILTERHGFTRFGFADPLKAMAEAIDPIIGGWTGPDHRRVDRPITEESEPWRLSDELRDHRTDPADPTGWEGAKADPEVRRLLQHIGVTNRQYLGEHVWIDALLRQINPLLAEGKPVVVPDVRFANEADAIWRHGGIVIRVNRPGTTDGTAATDLHISETALDAADFDHVIANNMTVTDLGHAVDDILRTERLANNL